MAGTTVALPYDLIHTRPDESLIRSAERAVHELEKTKIVAAIAEIINTLRPLSIPSYGRLARAINKTQTLVARAEGLALAHLDLSSTVKQEMVTTMNEEEQRLPVRARSFLSWSNMLAELLRTINRVDELQRASGMDQRAKNEFRQVWLGALGVLRRAGDRWMKEDEDGVRRSYT